MKDIKIIVATHKDFNFPESDLFLPVQVGCKITNMKLNIQGDDQGFNISEKNPYYCELTALYWSWKNFKADIVGLSHYRRYFNFSKRVIAKSIYSIGLDEINKVIPKEIKIREILSQSDIILPKPIVYPYSLDIDYKIGQITEDLNILYDVIKEISPEYYNSSKKYLLYNNKLYHYNMFISNYEFLNSYCEWLFKILFEVEKRIKLSPYPYQQRVFGFMGERLLGIYCIHNKLKIKEVPIYFVNDDQVKLNSGYARERLKNVRNNLTFYLINPKAIFK